MEASNKLPKFASSNHKMKRQIIHTEDGSHTLYVPELEEHFHSMHGAIQESMHVFVNNGLNKCQSNEINILEIGFGTGLNAFLTLIHKGTRQVNYFSLEKFPLSEEEYSLLNYPSILSSREENFIRMHSCDWNKAIEIEPGFTLTKLRADLALLNVENLPLFDLIYFDAFAPNKQPEMWQESIFTKIANHTAPSGIFVTYCAKGEVRRSLIRSGFRMQRLPGPPGKKEMLFGEKIPE